MQRNAPAGLPFEADPRVRSFWHGSPNQIVDRYSLALHRSLQASGRPRDTRQSRPNAQRPMARLAVGKQPVARLQAIRPRGVSIQLLMEIALCSGHSSLRRPPAARCEWLMSLPARVPTDDTQTLACSAAERQLGVVPDQGSANAAAALTFAPGLPGGGWRGCAGLRWSKPWLELLPTPPIRVL